MKLQATCPRCLERPSRRVLVNTSGRPALCVPCHCSPRFDHTRGRRQLPGRRPIADRDGDQIDRMYRAELAKIQRRRRGAA